MNQENSDLETASDGALIELTQRGDPMAANVLFSRHKSALYRTALRYLKNTADAEDAVQDGLILAYRHLSQFEGRARFRTWLVSIILNTARSRLRNNQLRRSLSVEEGLEVPGANPIKRLKESDLGPDQLFAQREMKRIVQRALVHLPSDLRAALHLRYLNGLSVREVACKLGVNQQTLKVRLFRGRRKLASTFFVQNDAGHVDGKPLSEMLGALRR